MCGILAKPTSPYMARGSSLGKVSELLLAGKLGNYCLADRSFIDGLEKGSQVGVVRDVLIIYPRPGRNDLSNSLQVRLLISILKILRNPVLFPGCAKMQKRCAHVGTIKADLG